MRRLLLIVLFCATLTGLVSAAEPTTAPASAPATAPSAAAFDLSTPRGTLKVFARALESGDRPAILEILAAGDERERKVAAATAELSVAMAQLRATAIKAFGADKSRALGVDTAASADSIARIDAATETIDGDSAVVRAAANEGPPMSLVRKGDKWLIPVAQLSKDVDPADVDHNLSDVAAQVKVMQDLSGEIAQGKFKSALDARQALDQRILKTAMPPDPAAAQSTSATTRP